MHGYMCLLIFIRISAATLHGRQTNSCNFTEILKAQELKISCRPSSNKIFYNFVPLGFGKKNCGEGLGGLGGVGGWGGVGGLSRKMDANPGK